MRKRIYIICFLIVVVAISAHAQRLGLVAGPELTYGNIMKADKLASIKTRPNAGVHAGLLFEMDVTNRWGFDVAALYELRHMGWDVKYNSYDENNSIVICDTTTIFNRQIGYFNVPFHFYVNFPTKDMTYSIFGGPVFTCGIHAKDIAWYDIENEKPVTYLTKDIFSADDGGRIVRCEIAAEVGVAFKWMNGVQLRASYQHSFNNQTLKNYTYTMPLENKSTYFTQGQLKISVAYMFDIRK